MSHDHKPHESGSFLRVSCSECLDWFLVKESAPFIEQEALCLSCDTAQRARVLQRSQEPAA